MAQQDEIRTTIRQFIIDTFLVGDEADTLKDSDSFMQTGVIDSTGVLEVTGFIESEYSVSVEDDELTPANLDSIDNLVGFIARKIG